MDSFRDVVSIQFVAACIGGLLVLVEIFRQGGRYSVARVCGAGLATALLLTLGASYLVPGTLFLRSIALGSLSFFGGYLGAVALVALYVVAVIGIGAAIVAVFHVWQWFSRKLRRTSRVVTR